MNTTTRPMTGGCLCGAVRYECTDPPDRGFCCHCSVCQKQASGPMMELSLRQSLILTDNDLTNLIDHPVAIVFLLLAVFSIVRLSSVNLSNVELGQQSGSPDKD